MSENRIAYEKIDQLLQLAATLKWPEIPVPRDWDDGKFARINFKGVPEFRGDGVGSGTPEFRAQLEAYFMAINVATRHAIAALSLSRRQMIDFASDYPDGAATILDLLVVGEYYATQLSRLLRAAAVRKVCGIAHALVRSGDTREDSSCTAQAGREPGRSARRKRSGRGD